MWIAILVVLLSLLFIAFIKLLRAYDRVCLERNWAMENGFKARQECNLLELKIAIIRFSRDLGRVPRSMPELRGHKNMMVDFLNPFTGKPGIVNDLTGRFDPQANPYDITFRYIPADDQGGIDERCVIAMHDQEGRPMQTCVYFAPDMVMS